MAFSREIYDEPAYKHKLYESTSSGKYQLTPYAVYRDDTCFQETPEIHNKAGAVYRNFDINTDLVDVESDLHNLVRKSSKDPRTQYPYTKKDYKTPSLLKCQKDDLSRRYPLLEAPSFKRSQSIHTERFESLCLNPQQLNRIHSNHYIGAHTRLWNRDNYVAKKPVVGETSNDVSNMGTNKLDGKDMKKFNCNCNDGKLYGK